MTKGREIRNAVGPDATAFIYFLALIERKNEELVANLAKGGESPGRDGDG